MVTAVTNNVEEGLSFLDAEKAVRTDRDYGLQMDLGAPKDDNGCTDIVHPALQPELALPLL